MVPLNNSHPLQAHIHNSEAMSRSDSTTRKLPLSRRLNGHRTSAYGCPPMLPVYGGLGRLRRDGEAFPRLPQLPLPHFNAV
ncbi:alpha-glucosidase [Coccidioides immitis RMSCC 3703]|uniref:Alpha-glucosidase n=1 Tax=Coccidioides immitis RMSCC 3703 TaxID=454286 RepID=A0A0J8R1B0_COCIT|nr:alpha-glucosidase [Coccidioides immitis RMSCC 3703]